MALSSCRDTGRRAAVRPDILEATPTTRMKQESRCLRPCRRLRQLTTSGWRTCGLAQPAGTYAFDLHARQGAADFKTKSRAGMLPFHSVGVHPFHWRTI
jgi:hypothetical protein